MSSCSLWKPSITFNLTAVKCVGDIKRTSSEIIVDVLERRLSMVDVCITIRG